MPKLVCLYIEQFVGYVWLSFLECFCNVDDRIFRTEEFLLDEELGEFQTSNLGILKCTPSQSVAQRSYSMIVQFICLRSGETDIANDV